MAGALSDIAAMSGRPVAALISLGLPAVPEFRFLESLYSGIDECAKEFGCAIVGGETVSTKNDLMITITIIGEVKKDTAPTRSGATSGDTICVTGTLGKNVAAMRCLQSSGGDEEMVTRMRDVFFGPRPRIPESEFLNSELDISSMIDLSDGLSTDLKHIATKSGVGVVVYEKMLPVATEALEVAKLLGEDVLDYALNGGEDYELLFTVHGGLDGAFKQQFAERFGITLTEVGNVVDSGLFIEGPNKVRRNLVPGGFDHMRRRGS
jgi:thiamine-monophosphate kinase